MEKTCHLEYWPYNSCWRLLFLARKTNLYKNLEPELFCAGWICCQRLWLFGMMASFLPLMGRKKKKTFWQHEKRCPSETSLLGPVLNLPIQTDRKFWTKHACLQDNESQFHGEKESSFVQQQRQIEQISEMNQCFSSH